MSLPTKGEEFSKLIEHLRKAQEACAMLAHLHADDDSLMSRGWLGVEELLKRSQIQVTKLATSRRGLIQ